MNILGLFEINKIKKVREVHIIMQGSLISVDLVGDGWGHSEHVRIGSEILGDWTSVCEILNTNEDQVRIVFEILNFFYKNHCEFKLIDKG